ncbi:ATP-binding cassette domain-containing protein [bacterium]|nr:ATP-binding cassette domain-containing protein [bacterium]
MSILRIENLSKEYSKGLVGKKFRALSNLSLEVQEGEIYGFLGPNGAGKTTTIKILLRIIFPTGGTAWLLDREISDTDTKQIHKIGYMPENPYFYRFLTGMEFLQFYARLADIDPDQTKKKAEELLDIVSLTHAAKTRIGEYSKGMVTRIGIAQALITDPVLLLMDEPMSGLDPIGRREIRDLILRLKEEKKTIFFCSHILADVEMLCDRIAILDKGVMVKEGTVQDILAVQESSYVVSLDHVSEDAANRLKSAAAKHEDIGGILHLTTPNQEKAQKLAEQAMAEQAKIIEIRPERKTLEDYFVKEVANRE